MIEAVGGMQICFACDDLYARHLEVVIRSIAKHRCPARITVITDGISRSSADGLRSACDQAAFDLTFAEIGHRLPTSHRGAGHLTKAAYARLFAPEIIREAKAIYLDIDIVCVSPLTHLWDVDIGNCSALMVESSWAYYKTHKRTIGLAPEEPYYNSGVMVLNLDTLRDVRFAERALQIARGGQIDLKFADQDIINILLKGSVRPLHPRWNVATALFDWRPGDTSTFGEAEVRQAVKSPAIIHYTGSRKPWARRLSASVRSGLYTPHDVRAGMLLHRP